MKKIFSLILSLAMLLSIVSVVDFSAYADVQTGKCGNNVTYSFDTETGVLTISGTGDMTDYWNIQSPFYYNNSLKSVIIESGITSIGNYLFYVCKNLTSVTIPNSVTKIGFSAFNSCESLTSVTIPNTVTSIGNSAFDGCTNLTSVTIPTGVIGVGNSTFKNCESLTSITIPDNVTYIGESAFFGCDGLTSLTIPNSVTSIDNYAFSYCTNLTHVKIPNSVTKIGDDAFKSCDSMFWVDYGGTIEEWETFGLDSNDFTLRTAVIKCTDGVKGNRKNVIIDGLKYMLGNYTASLIGYNDDISQNITIPESIEYADCRFKVTAIDEKSFKNCEILKSVTIGNNVINIGDYAFSYCTNLKSVTIGNSVTSIGERAFISCTSLINIIIPNSVITIGDAAFISCSSLTDATIGNSVTSIADYTFDNCTSLSSVTIGNNVTRIGEHAFNYCKSLTNVIVPSSVTIIDDYAFISCKSLINVSIENSETSIGSHVFDSCDNLVKINFNGTISQWNDSIRLIGVVIKCTDGAIGNMKNVIIDGLKYQLGLNNAKLIGYTSRPQIITIPENIEYVDCTFKVTSIVDNAFSGCESLTSVTIPNSITSIGTWVFNNCSKLDKINYNGTVSQWKSIDGYSNVDEIIKCTDGVIWNGNTITIDNITYRLSDNNTAQIINYTGKSENLTIPESFSYEGYTFKVTSIGYSAFYGCESLKSVIIPNSVTSIGTFAFDECTNLTNVYYGGSQNDWNKIDIGRGNKFLTDATIHCSLTPTPEPEPTPSPAPSPTPSPAPSPTPTPTPTQPQPTTTAPKPVLKPKSAKFKKVKPTRKAVSVEWKKVSGVKGYQVQVATDKKFKKNKKTATVKKQKTTKVTIKKLKAKKKYYVRIRTYKTVKGKKIYSSWSKVKTIKTK